MSEHIIDLLDDYLDGELLAGETRRIEAHIAECADCREAVDRAHALLADAARLPREFDPPAGLWNDIEARLAPRQQSVAAPRWMKIAAAVAVIGIVFTGGIATDRLLKKPDGARQLMVETQRAKRELPESYLRLVSTAGFSDATEAEMLRNLLKINLAIRDVKLAINEHPDDTNLRGLLAALYEQENGILNKAVRMSAVNASNTRTGI